MRSGIKGWQYVRAVSLFALVAGITSFPTTAQVAPTQVNEPAVDEFGLERKTGRFQWQSHEIIGVGGEDSGLGIVTTGVENPSWVSTIMPAKGSILNFNEPELSSYNAIDPNSIVSGGIYLNRFKRTVSFEDDSETFECGAYFCMSEYFTGSSLEIIPNGFLFTNTQGVKVYFEHVRSRVVYPDGRELTYEAGKFRKNNFGYMLRYGANSIQAVNQAVDYCDGSVLGASCSNLTEQRTASITYGTGLTTLTDAVGGQTKLRWEDRLALIRRRPMGAPSGYSYSDPSSYIPSISQRYLMGITPPGKTAESTTITYNTINVATDPHDDIRVASIIKNGVTANYTHLATYPYGLGEAPPATPNGGGGNGSSGGFTVRIINNRQWDNVWRPALTSCAGGNWVSCDIVGNIPEAGGGGIDLPDSVFNIPTQGAPPDEPGVAGSTGNDTYYLQTWKAINGVLVDESAALKPEGSFGRSRRRLLNVTDALQRSTTFLQNTLEEFAGVIYPEKNEFFHEYDGRANIVKTIVRPKPDLGLPDQETLYEYEPECTPTTQARCNKPLKITDPKGNITEYSYNDRGQVLTETKPAPTPGAPRPKVTNSYELRTAYIKDASGGVVPAGPPISLLVQSSACNSTASCAGTVDEVLTSYDYGPTTGLNNLRLRGVAVTAQNSAGQMETLRTCYQYNYFGERISETKPQANLAVCP